MYLMKTWKFQINPDPDLEDNPEIDIFKTEEALANGVIDDYYDEEELGGSIQISFEWHFPFAEEAQKKLKKKLAWRKKVNIFTGKR